MKIRNGRQNYETEDMKPDPNKREQRVGATTKVETQHCKIPQQRIGILRQGKSLIRIQIPEYIRNNYPKKHPNICRDMP